MNQMFDYLHVTLNFRRLVLCLYLEYVGNQYEPTAEEKRGSRACYQGFGVTVHTNCGTFLLNSLFF